MPAAEQRINRDGSRAAALYNVAAEFMPEHQRRDSAAAPSKKAVQIRAAHAACAHPYQNAISLKRRRIKVTHLHLHRPCIYQRFHREEASPSIGGGGERQMTCTK